MEAWEEVRINRLEDRVDRLERKDWERRDFILRWIVNGLTAVMIVLSIVAIVLSATQPGH
ncbi:MAG TPA: hypothetical protein VFS48_02030 [Solirubrobacterales bacterium]|nr:hypothetical protein [Solirubrobacterales bacterium]